MLCLAYILHTSVHVAPLSGEGEWEAASFLWTLQFNIYLSNPFLTFAPPLFSHPDPMSRILCFILHMLCDRQPQHT